MYALPCAVPIAAGRAPLRGKEQSKNNLQASCSLHSPSAPTCEAFPPPIFRSGFVFRPHVTAHNNEALHRHLHPLRSVETFTARNTPIARPPTVLLPSSPTHKRRSSYSCILRRFWFDAKVSLISRSGGVDRPSHLKNEMAEQGHKARASAARLEDTGASSVSVSNKTRKSASEVGSEGRGMMPLRCSVSGRQAGVWIVWVVANYCQVLTSITITGDHSK